MDAKYVERSQDWIKWYMYHRESMKNASIDRQVEFLLKTVQGLLELHARTVDQMVEIETGRLKLILPSSIEFHEPIKTPEDA